MSFSMSGTVARMGTDARGLRRQKIASLSAQPVKLASPDRLKLSGLSKTSASDRQLSLSVVDSLVPRNGDRKSPARSVNPLSRDESSARNGGWFKDFAVPPLAFGGGDNGGDGRPPVKRHTGGGGDGDGKGDDEPDEESPASVFSKNGVSIESLPEDIQFGIREGRFTGKDATQWLNILKIPFIGGVAKSMPAVREKLLGNPRLIMTVGIELAIGVTAKLIAEVQARQEDFWKELDFVASDVMLEIVADFSLVWLLSPALNLRPIPTGKLARTIATLPGHASQKGAFALWQRASTIAYRAVQFFCVGMVSTMIGHGSTMALANARGKVEGQKELSPLLPTAVGWASFMVISSNFRYQTVNGIEERLFDACLKGAPRNVATFFLRFGNCWFGGMNWIWYARAVGLQ